jgi:transcriptional regulator
MHGYAITTHIQTVSGELLRVEEGSLYPALHRMEQDGWVRAEWGKTEKNREARFYALTACGRRQLAQEEESWGRLTEGVARVMRYA